MGFVCSGFLGGKVRGVDRAVCGRSALRAMAEEWTPVGTVEELNAEGGKKVVKIDSGKVLIREFAGDILAMSNSCPHLGLPLEVLKITPTFFSKSFRGMTNLASPFFVFLVPPPVFVEIILREKS